MADQFEEGDKLLAAFMKWHHGETYLVTGTKYEYRTSWDWLMPVYFKFRDLKLDGITARHYHKQVLTAFGNGILNSDRFGAWNDAVMAVKWYNELPKN